MPVYVVSATTPPANPVPIETFSIPAIATPGNRGLEGFLTNTHLVQAGEEVYVALQLPGTDACVVTCPDSPHTGRDFWSNAAAPPFNWVTFESFGVNDDLLVEARGFIQPPAP